jgi:hypothetical protein
MTPGVAWFGVPPGLWMIFLLAIAAAIVAVVVAWRSNVTSRRYLDEQLTRGWQQLVRQLKHEADQRAKERAHELEQLGKRLESEAGRTTKELQHSLRRDVYLEAAAALLRLHTLLCRAANLEVDHALLSQSFAEDHARVVRIHLVGTEPTVEIVMRYMNELAPAFAELTALRRQLAAGPPAAASAGHAELRRRSIALTTQSVKLLAGSLLALRNEMGGPLDQAHYEKLWQVQFGRLEPIWKQDIVDPNPAPASDLPDFINRIFP